MNEKARVGHRILIVQYAGDYAEARERLANGGSETYFAQRHSVDAIARLAALGHEVSVVVAMTASAYERALAPGLVAVGLGFASHGEGMEEAVLQYAQRFQPTHLLLRTPMTGVLRWAIGRRLDVLVTLADSFGTGFRSWAKSRWLVWLLNRPQVTWVANHGVTSSRSLVRLGVAANKVIPWDWPHVQRPEQMAPKTLPARPGAWRALFVGAVSEAKGVGDALRAIALLKAQGVAVSLDVVGAGDDFAPLASSLGIVDRVRFVGRLPNSAVIGAMRAADAVLVPSRKEYPEGFPLTIYEALCSRTPLVVSDHPMFVEKLRADTSAIIFRAGDASGLAAAVRRLFETPALYAALSSNAAAAWDDLQVPAEWSSLVEAWLRADPAIRNNAWSHRTY